MLLLNLQNKAQNTPMRKVKSVTFAPDYNNYVTHKETVLCRQKKYR
ncbi:hypothetical protein SAMN04488122_1976 [Chitinophaga arvensicola]|uniref:Uncharacterized protein n=1 Tax=Chitinophaga arvensicola TaxID=29529 RepID=A0A1I0QZR4_9BACT|nr:hypothetical protein SAMN04488122_1976 [Chitinophaga arvensicola]